jgi:transcriptional regulator with XRE-family HTH domain
VGKQTSEVREAYENLRLSVVQALADRSLAKVARACGLHENTVRSIAAGKNTKPAIETLETLADHLFGAQ